MISIDLHGLAADIIRHLNDNEFCSCDHPVAELIPQFRTYQCRSCGRPHRAICNKQAKDT